VATEDRHNDENPAPGLSERGAARRRLSRAAGAGVLFTLGSKGAMGVTCLSPSGYLSGGLNSHYGSTACGGGYSPGYWKNHAWPAGIDRTKFRFTDAFPMPVGKQCLSSTGVQQPASNTSYGCALLDDVISRPSASKSYDADRLGMHMAATYLNIRAGYVKFLTVEKLQEIWREVTMNTVYQPTAGVTWSRAQLVAYLKATMQ